LRRNGDYRPTYSFEWLSRAAALRVHHARPIIVDGRVEGVLLLSRSARTLYRGLYQDRGRIALGIALILLALFVLAALLSRGIARPIEALRAASHDVARGQDAQIPDVPVTAASEIQDLYRDFGVMAAAIDRRSRYLRDFAHSVSHEFKTPLAAIRGGIELLRDHGERMTPADRERFLANIDEDSERLTRLLSRLLDLARADMAPARDQVATFLDAPMTRAAHALRSATFDVVLDIPPALPAVLAPEELIEAVLTALLENSRQAGAPLASIAARADGSTVTLTVSDDGPGIPESDRERVFEPFFTGRRESGGTGLGLAIVRSLLSSVNGTVEAMPITRGSSFRVRLPKFEAEKRISHCNDLQDGSG
jgi:signal transduction histidine kinase